MKRSFISLLPQFTIFEMFESTKAKSGTRSSFSFKIRNWKCSSNEMHNSRWRSKQTYCLIFLEWKGSLFSDWTSGWNKIKWKFTKIRGPFSSDELHLKIQQRTYNFLRFIVLISLDQLLVYEKIFLVRIGSKEEFSKFTKLHAFCDNINVSKFKFLKNNLKKYLQNLTTKVLQILSKKPCVTMSQLCVKEEPISLKAASNRIKTFS